MAFRGNNIGLREAVSDGKKNEEKKCFHVNFCFGTTNYSSGSKFPDLFQQFKADNILEPLKTTR